MEHMEVMQLGEGFWRWTAPHPEWTPAKERPGGWGQRVGCLYLETSDGIVLIDPLAPPDESDDGRRFWEVLDREVARLGKPVTILLGNHFHQRSAPRVLERYRERPGAEAWAPEKTRFPVRCRRIRLRDSSVPEKQYSSCRSTGRWSAPTLSSARATDASGCRRSGGRRILHKDRSFTGRNSGLR